MWYYHTNLDIFEDYPKVQKLNGTRSLFTAATRVCIPQGSPLLSLDINGLLNRCLSDRAFHCKFSANTAINNPEQLRTAYMLLSTGFGGLCGLCASISLNSSYALQHRQCPPRAAHPASYLVSRVSMFIYRWEGLNNEVLREWVHPNSPQQLLDIFKAILANYKK